MFKFLMICAIIGLATAFPSESDAKAEVVTRTEDVRADGFDSALETSNGIVESRHGDEHGVIKGSYSYVSPEGEHIDVTYVADENGFQPQGAHLPTSPPIPEPIVKALAYLAAHPSTESH